MKKSFIVLLSFLGLSATSLQAQVTDAIKSASKSSSSSSSKSSGGGSISSGDVGSSLSCLSSCFDIGCQIIGTQVVVGLWRYHEYINEQGLDRTTSIEAQVVAGGNTIKNYYTLRPRIRGNWGFFSTDFRVAMLYDYDETTGAFGGYHTKDWQILGFNLVAVEAFNLRLASGFMYEDFQKKYYLENSAMADVYFNKWHIGAEGRISHYTNGVVPRSELSLKTSYRIGQSKHLQTFVTAEGVYNQYFSKVNTWTLGAGVGIRFK
jgi:hypothetical protein